MKMQLARDGGDRTTFYVLGFKLERGRNIDWPDNWFGGWDTIEPEEWEASKDAIRLKPGEGPVEVEVTIVLRETAKKQPETA